MYTKKILSLFFCFITTLLFSQEKYEYFGAISFGSDTKSVISYRLVFTEIDGKISGYSVTDLTGEHETKNLISGSYNKKTKEFTFKEEDILYTKSTINDEMFCFINFTGKVKSVDDNSKLEGSFKGFFKDNTKCVDGTIQLIGSKKLYKKMHKMNRKIQKSKRFDDETKRKANPLTLLDSLKVNNLIKNQNLNVFVKSDTVVLEVWDAGKEDGDIIQLYHNNELVLKDYKITNKKKLITISIQKENIFRIIATNEGKYKPNTAMIRLIDNNRNFELMSSLKEGEAATITILKNRQ
ncbi:hypothetical protein [Flavobacterium litorale]|uniref:DUF3108 domain-containing protein n=1 Tax=Flavobacterium litorale TaxID=2856519 RepID=A0ABX8V2U8_9FLAO|nr:hypothetical protein [Flavobacterium litorale]QYJ67173.1 hypothetical protein K1I41_06240 [Flavobacterium litorale]